jgi:membrane protein implicated in regulation of membrane protease activity
MIIFASTSAFVTFLAIAVFGFVFLLASAVLGDLFEHGDLGHDVGDHGGPSILSTRVLSGFVTAFGGFGAIAVHLGYGVGTSTAIGFGGGVLFAGLVYLFIWVLFSQQASSHVVVGDLVGRSAEVSVAIPKGGLGQVRCTLGDNVIEKIARSKDNEEIPANSVVKIEAVVGETVLVRRSE